jgi:hypothetical protein
MSGRLGTWEWARLLCFEHAGKGLAFRRAAKGGAVTHTHTHTLRRAPPTSRLKGLPWR